MFKWLLISIVIAPVLIGMAASARPRRRVGLMVMLTAVFLYDLVYLLMVYYLRIRWVG